MRRNNALMGCASKNNGLKRFIFGSGQKEKKEGKGSVRDEGHITDDEFNAQKAQLLGNSK